MGVVVENSRELRMKRNESQKRDGKSNGAGHTTDRRFGRISSDTGDLPVRSGPSGRRRISK